MAPRRRRTLSIAWTHWMDTSAIDPMHAFGARLRRRQHVHREAGRTVFAMAMGCSPLLPTSIAADSAARYGLLGVDAPAIPLDDRERPDALLDLHSAHRPERCVR